MPEPLSPKMGLGMKVAVLPLRQATFLTMYLNVISRSATSSSVPNLKLISACPAVPTSWCARSTSNPAASSSTTISSRRSAKWSTGGTGKYPPLYFTLYPRLPPSSTRPVFQAPAIESML